MKHELIDKQISCPYCGESIDILIDCSVLEQSYIEDCQVCCRPINICASIGFDDEIYLQVSHENE